MWNGRCGGDVCGLWTWCCRIRHVSRRSSSAGWRLGVRSSTRARHTAPSRDNDITRGLRYDDDDDGADVSTPRTYGSSTRSPLARRPQRRVCPHAWTSGTVGLKTRWPIDQQHVTRSVFGEITKRVGILLGMTTTADLRTTTPVRKCF